MQRVGEWLPSKISSEAPSEPSRNSSATNGLREIAALVTRLLGHYWTADEPAAVRQAQIEDWLDDLREFSVELVVDACREWRRRPGGKRPTPGDIRTLCVTAQVEQNERLMLAAPLDVDAYARELGWASEAERRAAIARDEERKRQRDAEFAARYGCAPRGLVAEDR